MSKRGSMQLLLLFFRSRATLGWGIGAGAGFLVLVAALQVGGGFPLMARTGLAQVLRQTAWEQALAGLPAQTPLPWEDAAQGTNANVPLLGLSAAVLKDERSSSQPPEAASGDAQEPQTKLGDVEVGDKITVTTADGASRVYKVTGRRVVDPHLAETEDGPSDADVALVTCSPLDPFLASSLRLIIQAIKIDPPAAPEPSVEQKL
jgi:hypothetical protein